MVTRGFASCQFAGRSSFGLKFANSSDAMPTWGVNRLHLISLQGFPTFVGHISPYRCARNFNILKLKFSFYLAVLLNYYTYTYSFFDFFTQFVKKTGHLLLGLSCKVFTFDHLFSHRSDFFNNLTTSLTKSTEYLKNRCLSSSTNSVRLHFRERVEKTKENATKTKIENLQNGHKKYGGKKFAYVHICGKNLKNTIISSNFSLKLFWTVI